MKRYTYCADKSKSGLKIFHYTVPSKDGSTLKCLALSDLHIFSDADLKNMDIIIKELQSSQYDILFLVGDIADQATLFRDEELMTNRLLNFIRTLGTILPVYLVYGNHDEGFYVPKDKKLNGSLWLDGSHFFNEKFHSLISGYEGVHILDNKTVSLRKGYTLSGINPSINYMIKDMDDDLNAISNKVDLSFLEGLQDEETNILLCHYPDLLVALARDGLLQKVDLCISGHNHNGCTQLRIFPIEAIFDFLKMRNRGIITPCMSILPKDTKNLRGVIEFDERTNMSINPCVKTFSACGGSMEKLDSLFYKGATSVEFVPEKEFTLKPKK